MALRRWLVLAAVPTRRSSSACSAAVIPLARAALARILAALDAAVSPRELDLPSFKLHPLKGQLRGHWSIWVNGNWRVTFRFRDTDIELVDYLDYH